MRTRTFSQRFGDRLLEVAAFALDRVLDWFWPVPLSQSRKTPSPSHFKRDGKRDS